MSNTSQNVEVSHAVPLSMNEMIKGLEKPPKANDNDLGCMNDDLRSFAKTIKDKFVEKLLELDPLAPQEMIRLSNSCLKLLYHFPFDTDSLYLSVKKFIIGAHELACAKENVDLEDRNYDQLDEIWERVRTLTEEKTLLKMKYKLPDKILKDIDDQMKPLRSQLSALEAKKGPALRVKNRMESNLKKILDANNLIDELVKPIVYRS